MKMFFQCRHCTVYLHGLPVTAITGIRAVVRLRRKGGPQSYPKRMSKMPPRRRKPGARKAIAMQSFVFEIVDCAPYYSLSIRFSANDRPHREIARLTLSCLCVFPKKLMGLITEIDILGDRDCLEPECWKIDPGWKPRCVGQPRSARIPRTLPYCGAS